MAEAVAAADRDPAAMVSPPSASASRTPKGGLPRGEIVGAVDRIDDPAQASAEPLEDRRVGMRRFLADHGGFGQ